MHINYKRGETRSFVFQREHKGITTWRKAKGGSRRRINQLLNTRFRAGKVRLHWLDDERKVDLARPVFRHGAKRFD